MITHTASAPLPSAAASVAEPQPPAGTVLDVVVPVYNEEADLEPAIRRLHQHLSTAVPFSFRITIADNASTDATAAIADALAEEFAAVSVVRIAEKGRGGALAAVWSTSDASVLAYLDVDMSTDLAAMLPLVAPLISGHSDVAIGTRLHRAARVVRGPKREAISRCYNLILHSTLRTHFSDAQCGFKAIRADVAGQLLPLVRDTGWFFDTELLVLAERAGLRIHEVPVDWVDDPGSRVAIASTAVADLKGIWRLGRALATRALPLAQIRAHLGRDPQWSEPEGVPSGMTRQAVWFSFIGAVSTAAYLLLYALLRTAAPAQLANLIAMIITTVANTAANRRLTFGIRGSSGAGRHQLQGMGLFLLSLVVTSGSLALLHLLHPQASTITEMSVLLAANVVAAVLRFLLMRSWMFRHTDTGTVIDTDSTLNAGSIFAPNSASGTVSTRGLRETHGDTKSVAAAGATMSATHSTPRMV